MTNFFDGSNSLRFSFIKFLDQFNELPYTMVLRWLTAHHRHYEDP
jgi:hypothetical protein